MELMTDSVLRRTLSNRLSHWNLDGKRLQRTFQFPSFRDAMRFVNRVADGAEKMNHHPDIEVRDNEVSLGLSSHERRRHHAA